MLIDGKQNIYLNQYAFELRLDPRDQPVNPVVLFDSQFSLIRHL